MPAVFEQRSCRAEFVTLSEVSKGRSLWGSIVLLQTCLKFSYPSPILDCFGTFAAGAFILALVQFIRCETDSSKWEVVRTGSICKGERCWTQQVSRSADVIRLRSADHTVDICGSHFAGPPKTGEPGISRNTSGSRPGPLGWSGCWRQRAGLGTDWDVGLGCEAAAQKNRVMV